MIKSHQSELRNIYQKVRLVFPDAPARFENTINSIYTRLLTVGAQAIDVGAHTGKHTIPMAEKVGPRGKIFAFEPIIEKACILQNKLLATHLENTHVFNVCCSDRNGIVEFTYLPDDPGKSSINLRSSIAPEASKLKRRCLAVALDVFLMNECRPEFIKIDVEGAELNVLRGAHTILSTSRPVVHVELGLITLSEFDVRPPQVYHYLQSLEYDLYDILGNRLDNIERFNESIAAGGIYDYIAVPNADPRSVDVMTCCSMLWTESS